MNIEIKTKLSQNKGLKMKKHSLQYAVILFRFINMYKDKENIIFFSRAVFMLLLWHFVKIVTLQT